LFVSEKQIFENLALKHMDNLYSKATRLVGNAEGAEILVQQTYATAFVAFERFDKNSDFNTWQNEILMLVYLNSRFYAKVSADN